MQKIDKTGAIRYILTLFGCGLPRAIEIYNYLTINGEIKITKTDINNYKGGF